MKRVLAASMLALLAANALPVAASSAQTGEMWETRMTMRSAQTGEMAMPPQRICQPPATRDPKNLLPHVSEECPGLTMRQQRDRVSWSGQCKQGHTEGEVRFVGTDRMEGRMKMATAQGEFAMDISGRKLGACKLEAK